jgi:hypothetical protein
MVARKGKIWKETYLRPQVMKSFQLIARVPLSKITIDKVDSFSRIMRKLIATSQNISNGSP